MHKYLKLLIKITVALAILAVILIAGVVTFVDPNNYKNEIHAFVEKATGRSFMIKGSIQWSLSPEVTLYAQELHLSNLPQFSGDFLSAKEASIRVSLTKLILRQEISIKGLEIHGLTVNISRNSDRISNIDDFITEPQSSSKQSSDSSKPSSKITQVRFDELIIKDSQLFISDEATKQNWKVKKLNIATKNFALAPNNKLSPIAIQGTLVNLNDLSQAFKLETKPQIDLGKKIVHFTPLQVKWRGMHYIINAKLNYAKEIAASGNAELLPFNPTNIVELPDLPNQVTANLGFALQKEQLTIKPLTINIDKGKITGQVTAKLAPLHINYDLNADKIVARHLAQLPNVIKSQQQRNAPSDKTATGTKPTSNEKDEPLVPAALATIHVDGKLTGTNLNLPNALLVDKFEQSMKIARGIAESTANLKIAKGTHQLYGKILAKKQPEFTVEMQSKDFAIEPLIAAYSNVKATGTGDLNLDFTATGNNKQELLNTLNGNYNLQVKDGSFNGVDIPAVLKQAEASLADLFGVLQINSKNNVGKLLTKNFKAWKDINDPKATTPFTTLESKASFRNGKSTNSIVNLDHATYSIAGNGALNLAANSIDYKFNAKLKQFSKDKEVSSYMTSTPVTVKVAGKLDAPKFSVDIQQYLHAALLKLQQDLIKQAAKNLISDQLEESLDDPFKAFESIFKKQ